MRKTLIILMVAAVVSYIPTASYAGQLSCNKCSYCSKMRSCKLANYCFRSCGKRRLDRDKDGIPCENICGKTKRQFKIRVKR